MNEFHKRRKQKKKEEWDLPSVECRVLLPLEFRTRGSIEEDLVFEAEMHLTTETRAKATCVGLQFNTTNYNIKRNSVYVYINKQNEQYYGAKHTNFKRELAQWSEEI
jgi:hypothetical protein